MQYHGMSGGGQYPYPNFSIDPKLKNADWCMQYAKAAYFDWCFIYPKGVFANNAGDYDKFKMYALAKQPISPYKKWLGVDSQTNNTWLSVDWSVRSIISPYRDKAISRLMEQEFSIMATPIDMTAKSELDEYYNEIKAKLAVRELLRQTNSELGSHPLITLQSGEPMDVEELEMRIDLGEQFNRSKDAELAIELGLYENDYRYFRRGLYEDLFDLGVTGYKEWLGDDNKAKYRKVNPENIITNYCRKNNFSDLVHAGEVIDVSLVDLATVYDKDGNKVFTEKELIEFAGSLAGKWNNPNTIGQATGWFKPFDKFKCKVLDIEFITYNEYAYRDSPDEYGNNDFRKAEYGRGKTSDKYKRKCFQYVYKCKWVIGTDKCYDWGMCYDQKRAVNPKKKAATSLSYKFFAYNFYEMRAQGFMERLIPYIDEFQLTMLKIQNFKNRAVPSGWWIDLDALENVALNKGGKNMEPKELLQMFFETGVLLGRSKDAANNPMGPNWKPVIPIENTAVSELAMFYQDLLNITDKMDKITGYNDITNGEGNPKTLVPGYEIAEMSTQHALAPMKFAERWLSEKLSEDVLCRMQQGIKKGGIDGYARALNENILRFIKISPEIAIREYGIMLQERTTDQQKIWILNQVQQDIANGFLDTSDAILIINTHNAKQAMQILSYRVKKAKIAMNQQELAKIQTAAEGNNQIAQIAEQSKMQIKQMELMADIEKEKMRIMGELQKKQMEVESNERIALQTNLTKIQVSHDTGDAKEAVGEVTAHAKVASTVIAGEQSKEKQEIANKKPVSKSKK